MLSQTVDRFMMSVSHTDEEDRRSVSSRSSTDSVSVALDDKERLVNIDSAIKWIKDELVSQYNNPGAVSTIKLFCCKLLSVWLFMSRTDHYCNIIYTYCYSKRFTVLSTDFALYR